ncbi:hypothetical protein FRC12_009258 [Ceratobasidium sp. 428]|nr:hypothetical protein FRC12_009258 [Ceratobasidium sp. 428]
MQGLAWESPGCDIESPRNVTCDQGFIPTYSVAAAGADDISKAVKFASKNNVKLVVKNTGHDYLGRPSGTGTLSVWTHQLKDINFADSFTPSGCPGNDVGVPAVTVGAGTQWLNVYEAANEHNVLVVGGGARSVGAAGGWLQGGGHSPLGGLYGMGVDNVLQFTVVKANGDTVSANRCKNKDLFWALRGGGGSTYGIALDVTYKTHPPLKNAIGVTFGINTTDSGQMIEAFKVFMCSLPTIMDKVGGGAVNDVDTQSTGLNPQWRKDALVSWTLGTGWTDDTPPEVIAELKNAVTNLTQGLSEIAGLKDAGYLNEADP